MLVLLGANVLRTLRAQRVHFHVHEHQGGVRHVHAHSHAQDDREHLRGEHRHGHRELGLGRALAVGMVHGAAGSAGLLVLAAAADSLLNAIGFVITFGLGSIMGMAALSFVAAYPLRLLERCASWFNTAVTVAIGSIAVIIGTRLFAQSLGAL